jgi:nicotinamide mononucleotide (NMN) deamidase PncC
MPPGTLCLGLAIGDRPVQTRALRMFGSREQMRQTSVITALDWLRKELIGRT